MMYSYVARQPILNAALKTVGYELLFRNSEENVFPDQTSANRATYRLITENFLSLGTNPNYLLSRCFINFPQLSLTRLLPLSLPKEKIVVEILETCQPNDELFSAIKHLHRNGYIIALDDFNGGEEWERFIPYAHIIKLDLTAIGIDRACDIVADRKRQGDKTAFLAERVESKDDFDKANQAGFRFFQGYFFSKPIIEKNKYVSPKHAIALQLFQEVCGAEVNFTKVEMLVSQDVSISYKLLRFVNAASPRLRNPITSFKQALIYLGEDQLRVFVALTTASYVSSNKPRELINLSMQRAHFCQQMSKRPACKEDSQQAFIVGLFSLLDALLDNDIETLIEALPLDENIRYAITQRRGVLGELLKLGEYFEMADWPNVESLCDKLKIELQETVDELLKAQKWSQEMEQHFRTTITASDG